MVKILSILLSALVLMQSVSLEVKDIAHLGDFMEHARFHAEKYGDSFLVFLSKHYGELQEDHNASHGEERKQHEELPFHHHSCQHSMADFVFLPRFSASIKGFSTSDDSAIFPYQETYASFEKFDIFQPPRYS